MTLSRAAAFWRREKKLGAKAETLTQLGTHQNIATLEWVNKPGLFTWTFNTAINIALPNITNADFHAEPYKSPMF
jgi:hypothetical protein